MFSLHDMWAAMLMQQVYIQKAWVVLAQVEPVFMLQSKAAL